MNKKTTYPTKTYMNLYYKPDRTTKPSTIALYALFALVVVIALGKFLVYDVWMERHEAEQSLAAAQSELDGIMLQLADYNEVRDRYFRYSATDEERALVDRMEVLDMLEVAVGNAALDSIDINDGQIKIQISNVTLAQIAEIVNRLEASPIVASTAVSTAATTETVGDQVQANITIQLQKEADD